MLKDWLRRMGFIRQPVRIRTEESIKAPCFNKKLDSFDGKWK